MAGSKNTKIIIHRENSTKSNNNKTSKSKDTHTVELGTTKNQVPPPIKTPRFKPKDDDMDEPWAKRARMCLYIHIFV